MRASDCLDTGKWRVLNIIKESRGCIKSGPCLNFVWPGFCQHMNDLDFQCVGKIKAIQNCGSPCINTPLYP